MRFMRAAVVAASVLSLSACAIAPPTSPRVMALPGAGKNLTTFQQEDASCRQYAYYQGGGGASAQNATTNAVGTAVAGTLVGAGLGAALGSLSGHAGAGAVVGSTAGALVGGSAAASGAQYAGADLQQRFDISYTQCMYARGNTVESPPGGYRTAGGYPSPYYGYGSDYGYGPGYYGPGYIGGPSVVIGGGWGWGHRWPHHHWSHHR